MDARAPALAIGHPAAAAAFAERLLNLVLFITVLFSFIAFIEPSPHDVMMLVLMVACVAARVPFDRKLTPLLVLIVVWLIGGAMSVIQVADTQDLHPVAGQDPIIYFGTSVYLGVAAIMFACLLSEGDLTRLAVIRRAYVMAALIAVATGYIGFFHLLPGANHFLIVDPKDPMAAARVSATFKDPNVYGPFLVFPLVILILRLFTQKITLTGIAVIILLLGGLLLSFSRGAWFHFALSAAVAVALSYATATDVRMRGRIVLLGAIAVIAVGLLLVAAMSIEPIRDMFLNRAKLIQPYDVGSGGRFTLQELALTQILENPNGLGPYAFFREFGGQQHNVYLQAFLVYGWLGGAIYLALIGITFFVGLAAARHPTPWQPYLIAAFGTYVGEIAEGMIVDTDHWRHFFLVVGMIWGLAVANTNYWRRQSWLTASA